MAPASGGGDHLAADEAPAFGEFHESDIDLLGGDRGDLVLTERPGPEREPREACRVQLARGDIGLDHNLEQCHFVSFRCRSTRTVRGSLPVAVVAQFRETSQALT